MIVEFTRFGKTYQLTVPAEQPPPLTLKVPFRPCALKPPTELLLAWKATDELRGVELYRAISGGI